MVVTSSREMDSAAIAINEQRFASNMMNVVSADEFGTIAEGSVGEFLKFMPGITIDFQNGDATSVSMNGAPSDYVPITGGQVVRAGDIAALLVALRTALTAVPSASRAVAGAERFLWSNTVRAVLPAYRSVP